MALCRFSLGICIHLLLPSIIYYFNNINLEPDVTYCATRRKGMVYNLVAPHDSKMIAQINEAIANQKHLNLEVIPEEKLKSQEQKFEKKVIVKKPASFRGKAPKKEENKELVDRRGRAVKSSGRGRSGAKADYKKGLSEAPVKRNRGIKRR